MSIRGGGVDLGTLQNAGAVPKLIRASKTFTGAANLGATGVNELFTTTGAVFLEAVLVRCTTTLSDTVDGAVFTMGITGQAGLFVDFSVGDLDSITAGLGLSGSGPATGLGDNLVGANSANAALGGTMILDNMIMTISTQAITGGVLEFYVLYRPLSSDGALTLGAGMVAI